MELLNMFLGNSWLTHWMPAFAVFFVLIGLAYFLFIPICVALVAKKKGRHGFVWFLLSIFINPIVALLLLIALGDKEQK